MTTIVKLDKQLLSQPKTVTYCKRCVVSNQRPRIFFDKDGVCSACIYREYEQTKVDWKSRDQELVELLDKHRSKDGSYDCVVPSSGGKDSGYVAYILKHVYGMHPICVTFAPFVRTYIGQRNFDAIIASGYPHIEGHPNGKLHRKLARLCFETLGDAWQPFGFGQMAYPHWMALQLGIKLIFYGECGEAQYSGAREVFDLHGMPPEMWATQYHKGVTIDDLVNFGIAHEYLNEADFTDNDLAFYRAPPREALLSDRIEMHWMGYYKYWVPQENYYTSSTHTGFEANPMRTLGTYSKYASLDDMTDGFHYYMAFIKFGIGRTTADAAHEIRDRHITREEGVALVKQFDAEYPEPFERVFLDYLGITREHFWDVVDAWRPEHLWERTEVGDKPEWKLRHQVS